MPRYPKPIEQRMREGNAGHRPLPEPVLIGGRPIRGELAHPPEHLPDDAQQFWRSYVPHLAACGIVDRVDIPALEMLSTQYARVRQAQAVIAEVGHFTRGSVGQLREHPAVKIEREATVLFDRLGMSFGLTPIGLTRLGLAELARRSLAQDLVDGLRKPDLRPVEDLIDGDVIDGDAIDGD